MDRFITWARENPQFAAVGAAVFIAALVVGILGVSMSRAGVSLKPLAWFVGFLVLVGGPQAVVHLLDGVALRRARLETAAVSNARPDERPEPGSALVPIPWPTVFGPSADPALITDARQSLSAILSDAEEARLSFRVDGSSALAARFPTVAAAAKALNRYGNFFQVQGARGSDAYGWTGRRHGGQGEWVHVVSVGPELYAWTGAAEAAVMEPRIRALGPLPAATESAAGTPGPRVELMTDRLRARPGLMAAFLAVNLVLAVGWFFKGSAWSARIDGVATARPEPADDVRRALLALNGRAGPTEVTAQPDGTLEINWRYADARWFDLMRLHRMKRAHRLVLQLYEANRTVRVREYWSAFDASAGPRDLRLQWVGGTGIQFFAVEHTRVLGVQLGPDGRPTGELSQAYTFDLQALKAPAIAAVTQAGWRWQPLVWNAPAAFRWITE